MQLRLDERESLNNMELEASGRYDKWILTLSAGALAISMTFIEKIAPSPEPDSLVFLYLGWFSLVITLIFSLFSHLTSQSAIRRQREILDNKITSQNPDSVKEDNLFSEITNFLNVSSIIFFVIGVLIICTFSIMNSPNQNMPKSTNEKWERMDKGSNPPKFSVQPNKIKIPKPEQKPKQNSGDKNDRSKKTK